MFKINAMRNYVILGILLGVLPLTTMAQQNRSTNKTRANNAIDKDHLFNESSENEENWVDENHKTVKDTINSWAVSMDSWFGTPDFNKPATANLRIMLDHEWNTHDGYSIKPRIRGKVKLPMLKKRFSLVFGDDSLDDQINTTSHIYPNYTSYDKKFNKTQARESNSSMALRWTKLSNTLGVETNVDLGIRSIDDPYVRVKFGKKWQMDEEYSFKISPIYRYGRHSQHYARADFELKRQVEEQSFNANNFHLEFTSKDKEDDFSWGNSTYRQYNFPENRRLNVGFYFGGDVEHKKMKLNGYGPFINWRQPFLRKWFFVQTEANYYNDKAKDRTHNLGLFLRLEAIF